MIVFTSTFARSATFPTLAYVSSPAPLPNVLKHSQLQS